MNKIIIKEIKDMIYLPQVKIGNISCLSCKRCNCNLTNYGAQYLNEKNGNKNKIIFYCSSICKEGKKNIITSYNIFNRPLLKYQPLTLDEVYLIKN